MAKLRLKTLRINNNSTKTIKECYEEYMDYCKAIGQRDATSVSKQRFYTYELTKLISVEENISKLTKEGIQKHINMMRDKGYKGNYYSTFVIKLRAFLTYCFNREYLEKFNVKIPNVLLEKKIVYTEAELNKLLKKPNLNTCLVGDYRSYVIVAFFISSGCRSETLLNVKVKDIDFENERVLFAHMKTKRQINVPLSKSLKSILHEYIPVLGLKEDDLLKYNPLDVLSKKNRKMKLNKKK